MRWRRTLAGPQDLTWWVAASFMVGASLFALGSFPPFAQLVAPAFVAGVFFAGSIPFTSAAAGQLLLAIVGERSSPPRRRIVGHGWAWWAAAIQFPGTIFFNVSTFDALLDGLSTTQVNRLVWAPDIFGSTAFLLASAATWLDVCGPRWVRRDDEAWWGAAFNALGSVLFGIAGLASLVLPTTGETVNLALVNAGTFGGGVCFFLAAYLLLPPAPRAAPA